MITPDKLQIPTVGPPVTGVSNTWPANWWEAHGHPEMKGTALLMLEVGRESGLAKANCMGSSHLTSQRCCCEGAIRSRVMGPSYRAVHGDRKPRRSSEQNTVSLAGGHLGTGTCGRSLYDGGRFPPQRGANRLDCPRRVNRCVADRKGMWTKPRPRVMPGIRGKFPAAIQQSQIPQG